MANMSDGREGSGSQKGTQRRGGGKKQGKVKGRDRHDMDESKWELQFMSMKEVSFIQAKNVHAALSLV